MSDNRKHSARGAGKGASANPRLEFRPQAGALSLYVDGKHAASLAVPAKAETDAPLRIFSLPHLCWLPDGELDTEQLAELVSGAAETGSALIMLEVCMDAPAWWLKENPRELAVAARGGSIAQASFASSKWRKEAGAALRRLLLELASGVMRDRIVAVTLLGGDKGTFGSIDSHSLPDTSECMREAFRRYASVKYRRNEGLLRKAWFDSRAEFLRITCPDEAVRGKSDLGIFRNPHRARRLLDFYEVLNEEQNESILTFASIVREASGGLCRVGVRSAAFRDVSSRAEYGRATCANLLDSDLIDYFVEARSTTSFEVFCPPAGSVTLAGKYRFIDTRAQAGSDVSAALHASAEGVGVIAGGAGAKAAFTLLKTQLAGRSGKKAGPDVALVLDPAAAQIAVRRPDCADLSALVLDQIDAIAASGTAIQVYALSDVYRSTFPTHKVVFLPNTWYLSEPEHRSIDARFKRSEQTIVWFWASGLAGEDAVTSDLGTRCCGQKLRLELGSASLRTRIASATDPIVWGRHQGEKIGSELPVAPIITVSDKGSIRLGANGDNKTTFSTRRYPTWTSIVTGTLPTPPDIIRNILRSAGCHQFAPALGFGDVLTADARSIAYTSRVGGQYTLFLPGTFDVTEVTSGKKMGQGVTEFGIEVMPGQALAFELKPVTRT